jgi:DNA-binding IclR family transcriptional regulator|tara:strand:+ start:2617 stop:2901 length:285 start_codon:yes stop_codon:yes gene_type:complete
MTPKQMAAIENERMLFNLDPNQAIRGRGYKSKVDLRALVFDVLRTREAWTVDDLAKRVSLKRETAHQLLKELKRDGYLTCRKLHDEFVFEHNKL